MDVRGALLQLPFDLRTGFCRHLATKMQKDPAGLNSSTTRNFVFGNVFRCAEKGFLPERHPKRTQVVGFDVTCPSLPSTHCNLIVDAEVVKVCSEIIEGLLDDHWHFRIGSFCPPVYCAFHVLPTRSRHSHHPTFPLYFPTFFIALLGEGCVQNNEWQSLVANSTNYVMVVWLSVAIACRPHSPPACALTSGWVH